MNNDSVRGYFVLTLKSLGYNTKEIDKILDELHWQFDTVSEYEAEQYYSKWRLEN